MPWQALLVVVFVALGLFVTLVTGDNRTRLVLAKRKRLARRQDTAVELIQLTTDILTPPPPAPADETEEEFRSRTTENLDQQAMDAVPMIVHEIEENAAQNPQRFAKAISHLINDSSSTVEEDEELLAAMADVTGAEGAAPKPAAAVEQPAPVPA